MSTFKNKTKKVYISDNRVTLDAKHNEMVRHFKEIYKSLPNKKKKLDQLKKEYKIFINTPNKDLDSDALNKKFQLKDEIYDLEKQIEKIENKDEENNYYLNTSNLLYGYYENLENISTNIQKQSKIKEENKTTILDMFTTNNSISHSPVELPTKTKNLDNFINRQEGFQGAKYFNQYLRVVDPSHINLNDYIVKYDLCDSCKNEKIYYGSEGVMVCEKCGEIDLVVMDCDKPSYKDPPPEQSYFVYKRINHYNECGAKYDCYEIYTAFCWYFIIFRTINRS